jgi:hypothetical protein
MLKPSRSSDTLAFALAFIVAAVAAVHVQQGPQPLNWAGDDEKRVAELAASGKRDEGTHVILWTPPGALGDGDRRALVERLDRGVAALRELVGTHPWQIVRDQKITYYISPDRFVAHASGRAAVFMPLIRLQDGKAPYFHEATHELLAMAETRGAVDAQRMAPIGTRPLWLVEGLPDYVALTAAAKVGVAEGDVFDIGGLDGVDRACAARLAGPAGKDVLPFIGVTGRPDALFTTDRQTVAPTFYACSTSFTKRLVGLIGLPATVGLIPLIPQNGVQARIEALTGKPIATHRAEWLQAIGYASSRDNIAF